MATTLRSTSSDEEELLGRRNRMAQRIGDRAVCIKKAEACGVRVPENIFQRLVHEKRTHRVKSTGTKKLEHKPGRPSRLILIIEEQREGNCSHQPASVPGSVRSRQPHSNVNGKVTRRDHAKISYLGVRDRFKTPEIFGFPFWYPDHRGPKLDLRPPGDLF